MEWDDVEFWLRQAEKLTGQEEEPGEGNLAD